MPTDAVTQTDREDHVTRLINRRTIRHSPSTERFFETTNDLTQEVDSDHASVLLKSLVKSLRKHCESLLPMASGNYKSRGNICVTPIVLPAHEHLSFKIGHELGHEGGHVAAHGIDYLLHELHQFDILHLAGSILNVIPFLAGVGCCLVKIYEVWAEHHLIEKIKKQLDKLNNFSNADREALYEFVIARTLLTLKTELSLCHTPTAWHFLLLSQSLASLSEISKEFKSLEQFGMDWSQSIIDQFKTYGVYMPTELVKYQKADVSVAYQVQGVFADDHLVSKDSATKKKYESLQLKDSSSLKSSLQKGLYSVLAAYEHRVSVPVFLSVIFVAYSPSQLKTLRRYFRQFNYALSLISEKANEINNSPTAKEQWAIIDNCLKGRLDEMAKKMKYSSEVAALCAETSSSQIMSIPVPLRLLDTGELAVQNPTVLARIRIEELEQANVRLASQVSTLEGQKAELTTQNSELSTQNSELSTQNSELSTQNSELSTQNSELTTRNSELTTLNSGLEERHRKDEKMIQALTTNNETQGALIETLMYVNTTQDDRIRRYEALMARQLTAVETPTQGLGFFDQASPPAHQGGSAPAEEVRPAM